MPRPLGGVIYSGNDYQPLEPHTSFFALAAC